MNKPINKIDKSYDVANVEKYGLNLLIGKDHITSSSYKIKSKSILAVSEVNFKEQNPQIFNLNGLIESIKASKVKISKKYKEVNIAISNTNYSFVPLELFDENNLKAYVQLNGEVNDDYVYGFNKIDSLNLIVVFSIPKKLKEWTTKNFPKTKLKHFQSILLESINRDFNKSSKEQVFFHIQKNQLDLIAFKGEKFILGNSFNISNPEDFIYYVLFTLKQLDFSPNEIDAHLIGEISKVSEMHELLYTYIRNIFFGERKSFAKSTNSLQDIPPHFFYTNFNQHLCE